jgi:hypothetical protein
VRRLSVVPIGSKKPFIAFFSSCMSLFCWWGLLYVVYLCGGVGIFGGLSVSNCLLLCSRSVDFWDGGEGMFSFEGPCRPTSLVI